MIMAMMVCMIMVMNCVIMTMTEANDSYRSGKSWFILKYCCGPEERRLRLESDRRQVRKTFSLCHVAFFDDWLGAPKLMFNFTSFFLIVGPAQQS